MASSKNISNTDEIRYQSYVNQLEKDQNASIQDKKEENKTKLSRIITTQEQQQDQIRKDYDVKISQEAEMLDRKLNLIRDRNAILINQERDVGEREADKMKTAYQQKIDQEKKIGDSQLSRLQQYYKKAMEELEGQFERDKEKKLERTPKV